MNYVFVVRQIAPDRIDYRFAVHLDVVRFRARCARCGILANFREEVWADEPHSWQTMIHETAQKLIVDQYVLKWMLQFAPAEPFFSSRTQGTFDCPTFACDGFDLLLLQRVEHSNGGLAFSN